MELLHEYLLPDQRSGLLVVKTNIPNQRAFTVIELLAVLAMVTLLACLCLPALARVRGQSWQAQCAANLKQLDLALQIYAGDNNNNLPAGTGWPFEMPYSTVGALSQCGAQRQQMYCPADQDQNQDGLWNYAAYRVTGYANALAGSDLDPDDVVTSLSARTTLLNGSDLSLGPAGFLYRINPSRRVLVADVIISTVGGQGVNAPSRQQATDWNRIAGGYGGPPFPFAHRTSHLNGTIPAGGNLGMLDGHVEWNSYTNIFCRSSTPGFWW